MNSIDTKAGVIIVTHRTPIEEAKEEMERALYAFLQEINANEQACIMITFEKKPIYEPK